MHKQGVKVIPKDHIHMQSIGVHSLSTYWMIDPNPYNGCDPLHFGMKWRMKGKVLKFLPLVFTCFAKRLEAFHQNHGFY
jgi:hypothetical protein